MPTQELLSVPLPAGAQALAQAAISVVARDGFDQLSVRRVAREADVAPGTVQHYFRTRAELLSAAFRQTVADIAARAKWPEDGTPVRAALSALLADVLPVDELRRRECTVWVALSAAAVNHPPLAAIQAQAVDRLVDLVTSLVLRAQQDGEVGGELDARAAAELLAAIVDGLTLQGITGGVSPARLVDRLNWGLNQLLRSS